MSATMPERRTDPRRGVVARVGLVLTATGIVTAAIDRRALLGAPPDVPLAVAFGLYLALIFMATFRRPMPGSTWIAFAAFALMYVVQALDVGAAVVGVVIYVFVALGAMLVTAPHLRPLTVGAFASSTAALWLFGHAGLTSELHVLTRAAAVIAWAFTVFAIVDPRRVHPSDRLRRVGYGMLAIACVSGAIARDLVVRAAGVGEVIAIVVAIALPGLAYTRLVGARRDTIATGLALAAFAFTCVAFIVGKGYHVDPVAAQHYAAELLVSGRNVYATFDLTDAVARFLAFDPELATHLESGEVLRTYAYPALSFVTIAPFVALGLTDVRWIYAGEVMLIAVLAISRLRVAWRPFALATLVGNGIVARQWILAGIDPSWALFVLCAWIARAQRWWSAVFMGLALASRQPAWFVAPFFFVAIAHDAGWRESLRRAAIAVVVALAVNVPFWMGAPERAIAGVVGPLLAPLVSDGVGLMRFGEAGVLPRLPREVYTALSAVVFAGLLALLWIRRKSLAGAPLVWPFVPLYFAWRSLQNYFAAAPLFALVGDDELEIERATPSRAQEGVPRT